MSPPTPSALVGGKMASRIWNSITPNMNFRLKLSHSSASLISASTLSATHWLASGSRSRTSGRRIR